MVLQLSVLHKLAYGVQKINIPKAPALGLLLEAPVYEGYNAKLQEFGYKAIDFSNYQTEMDAFKMKHIYDKIYKEEVDENIFNAFFSYIDSFNKVTGFQGEETETKKGANVQKSIFEFLTARGIPEDETIETKKNDDVKSEVEVNPDTTNTNVEEVVTETPVAEVV